MARKSALWNIWKAGQPANDQLNLGRQHAWSDMDPAEVVALWIAGRQRLNSRPLGLNAADYEARLYPVNVLDDYGVGHGG